ncbi:hypothetical protein ABPG77_005064 [Micractinium sp. CCAP 211/92]
MATGRAAPISGQLIREWGCGSAPWPCARWQRQGVPLLLAVQTMLCRHASHTPLCSPAYTLLCPTCHLYTAFACQPWLQPGVVGCPVGAPAGAVSAYPPGPSASSLHFRGGSGGSGGGVTGRGELAQEQEVGMAGLLGHDSSNGGGSRARGVLGSAQGSRGVRGALLFVEELNSSGSSSSYRLLLQSRSNSELRSSVRHSWAWQRWQSSVPCPCV